MRTHLPQSSTLAALVGGAAMLMAAPAFASNPLEYPDNGSASFSRGGAWLATADEPIATHYNPAALALQGSAVSIEQNLSFENICYDRHGPNNTPEGPGNNFQYLPACNAKGGFPFALPSISIAWRVSKKLGVGISVVPPATYGVSDGEFPATSLGINTNSSKYQQVPAPYRYMQLDQKSVILFPTIGAGYEIFDNFRVGVAFVSGIAVINATTVGIGQDTPDQLADHAITSGSEDGLSSIQAKDLFVPGGIVSIHWSPADEIDIAAWGRLMDSVEAHQGSLSVTSQYYNPSTIKNPDGTRTPPGATTNPVCRTGINSCVGSVAIRNAFGNETFREFKFPIPPEVRLGVRYHLPRTKATSTQRGLTGDNDVPKRDPLTQDVFDVEVDGSYTLNSAANTIEIRFADFNGQGVSHLAPVGFVPPNADRWNGYMNSYGVRLGGQYNVIPNKLGLRVGTWIETQSQQAQWLNVGVVGAFRGGFGGGVVLRQNFIDISIGYQHHWSEVLDNGGNGSMLSPIVKGPGRHGQPDPNVNAEPPGVTAATRTEYRSFHAVNDGRMSQSANVFTIGGTIHF